MWKSKPSSSRDRRFVYVLDESGMLITWKGFQQSVLRLISPWVRWAQETYPYWDKVYACFPSPSGTTYFHLARQTRNPYDQIPFRRYLEENADLLAWKHHSMSWIRDDYTKYR